jgi:hypothetical protein
MDSELHPQTLVNMHGDSFWRVMNNICNTISPNICDYGPIPYILTNYGDEDDMIPRCNTHINIDEE